jgi:hypothetical protein
MPPHDMVEQVEAVAEKERVADGAPATKEMAVDDKTTDVAAPSSAAFDATQEKENPREETESAEGSNQVESTNEETSNIKDNTDKARSEKHATESAEEPKQRFGHRISNLRKRLSERHTPAVTASASLASEAAATQYAKEEKCKEQSAVEKEIEKLQEGNLEAMRASKISVTVVKNDGDSYGFALVEEQEDDNKLASVKIDVLAEEGLLHQSPLKVGDKLVTINSKKVQNCDQVKDDLLAIDGPVTLVVETPQGNPSVVHAFCQKPERKSLVGIGFHVLEHGGHKLLQINYLDSHGLLAHSLLSQGDLVLAINDIPCAEKSPEEAAALILESACNVTILALNPMLAGRQHGVGTRAQRWIRSAKRAGIAIGGGTMVGVGLIFIPTLPPPFGEVLIVGGVSVLGTEFEAPKRLVRSTRDSLERSIGRNDATKEGGTEEGISDIAEGESTAQAASGTETSDDDTMAAAVASTLPTSCSSNGQPQKRTIGDKMKSFGRNYVLPFLDQVVGDHMHEQSPVATHDDAVSPDTPSLADSSLEAQLVEDENKAAKFHAQNYDAVEESAKELTGESREPKIEGFCEAGNLKKSSVDKPDGAAPEERTPASSALQDELNYLQVGQKNLM